MVVDFRNSEDKDRYYLYVNNERVGEVIMQLYKGYIALSHIDIYKEYRGQHLGKIAVKSLLENFNAKAIVGESLKTSAKFWNNCVNTFGGYTTKEGRLFGNTAFAFVVGNDEKIDDDLLKEILTKCFKY